MPYAETKVYFDGSHYIAIPHTTRPSKKRPKPKEEEVTVVEETPQATEQADEEPSNNPIDQRASPISEGNAKGVSEQNQTVTESEAEEAPNTFKTEKKTTRKELFEEAYRKTSELPARERKTAITSYMRPYFDTEQTTEDYVQVNTERKRRNLIARRIRCIRKANLQEFNYFVTFTYDGKLHSETSFKKQLKTCLRNFSNRKSWRYLGVWERSPEKKRLHFHGLFHIPDGTMPGLLYEKNDYSFNTHKRQVTVQNSYFNERFGRSDFEAIDDRGKLGDAMAYILKYIEKTGERIVYSKGLPQFFISDVTDDDVVCPIGVEDKKLLLFDNFICWDEGEYIGRVSAETIKRLRKSN